MDTYEKKYKEIVGLIKKAYLYAQTDSTKAVLEDIFPELKESEDETIRKAIHIYLDWLDCRNKDYQPKGDYSIKDMIAWLEKQGEKPQGKSALEAINEEKVDNQNCVKPIDKVEPNFKVKYAGSEYNVLEVKDIAGVTFYGIEDEPNHIDYVQAENCERVGGYSIKENGSPYPTKPAKFSEQKPNPCDGCINRKGCINCENGELREVEQKPAKARFKKGDWIVLSTSDGEKVVQIDSIEYFKSGEPRYITSEGRWFGNGTKARLLTDKDVETITLPKNKVIAKQKSANLEEFINELSKQFPDVSFAKLSRIAVRVAKWAKSDNDEMKELKKAEQQSSQWNISDFRTWQYIVSDVLTKYDGIGQYLDDGFCKKIAKYMQENWSKKLSLGQNHAWSEDDEMIALNIEQVMNCASLLNIVPEKIDKIRTWLKSLKERI